MIQIKRQEEKELAYREGGGIAVSLRWNRETGDVSVLVEDSDLDESFVVPAEPEQALQVFHHPYAYAARSRRNSIVRLPFSESHRFL
jgi:hypothetical protein